MRDSSALNEAPPTPVEAMNSSMVYCLLGLAGSAAGGGVAVCGAGASPCWQPPTNTRLPTIRPTASGRHERVVRIAVLPRESLQCSPVDTRHGGCRAEAKCLACADRLGRRTWGAMLPFALAGEWAL